jgi:hypothetical protein
MGIVDVKQIDEHELTLEWESSSSNDMIADSTLALISGIDSSPASVKRGCFLMLCLCAILMNACRVVFGFYHLPIFSVQSPVFALRLE